MTRTGPQKIPGASQQHFFGAGRYSGSDMEVNCGVAHTTEGMSLTTYSSGAEAPNVTGVPDIKAKKIRWYQHFDVDESARALVNRSGGVETNTANAFQIELVGTCDAKHSKTWSSKREGVDYIYWPDAPDWALAEVAWLVRWLRDYHNVPLTCVKDWLAYGADSRRPGITPASYGANPARMSMAAWRDFTGWCGHQHVPENDHGDPGAMNFARVIALAKGTTTPSEEDDMTPDQDARLKRIEDALAIKPWTYRNKTEDDAAKKKGKRSLDAYAKLTQTHAATVANTAALKALAALAGKNIDTAAVVAAVEAAIKDAVIKVDVDINQEA